MNPSTAPSVNGIGLSPGRGVTSHTSESLALRHRAEARFREIASLLPPRSGEILSETAREMLHELQVHQIELEMQNEELRRAQGELELAREKYFDLYELAPVGYCSVGQSGVIVKANLTLATLLGVPRSVLTQRLLSQFIGKDDQGLYYRLRRKLMAAGEPQSCDVRLVRGDTTEVWASLVATVSQDEKGAPVMLVALSDASERKRADELERSNAVLLSAEAFNRSIMDSLGAEIAVLDRDGVIVAVNEPWRSFGRRNGIVAGKMSTRTDVGANYLSACHVDSDSPDHEDAVKASRGIQAVLDGRSTGFRQEYRCPSPLRPHQWFLMNVSPLTATGGGAVILHKDISERKLVERKLREALLLQETILNGATHPIIVTSNTGVIRLVNAAAVRALGYGRQELVSQRFVTCLFDPQELLERAQELGRRGPLPPQDEFSLLIGKAKAGEANEQEWTLMRQDGSRFPALVVQVGLRNEGGLDGYVFVAIDITERRRSKLAVMNAMQAAESANLAKSRFMAAASHDLRQPLAALSLYVGLLKQRLLPGNDELLASLQSCVDSLSELMGDLLDVSKLSAGVVTPKLADFAVDAMLESVVAISSAEARLKGLDLRLRGKGWFTRSDRVLLQRIVSNFVANAISYTDQGGILIACRLHQGRQWIEVWDTGHGVPADKKAHIFEEFTQLEDSVQHRGSGLGLAIAAKMAAVLGLRIRMSSRPGRGSMFAVELPAGQMVVPAAAPPPQALPRALVIGVVDDDTQVLPALVLALQAMGHEVVSATNTKDFMACLAGRKLDIVLSDYRLASAGTGFGVIEVARSLFGADLPAIIITGDTDPALIRSMADRGIAVHFKPLKMDVLQALIADATRTRKP
ncbi:PAS domain S-box protein [Rhodoferax sp.]|uniref:PAS domain S-box protein n=1 Tax=Rhodoferax sp. TaxID=50421 RepID=UPI001ED29036|nr:PAS domain S-box protein [Rhodoferax sp.]MBT9505099.1 PAS domain S-box protein [Rhodoferax sp.]